MLKDFEKQSIKVTIRVRPQSEKELFEDNRTCIKLDICPQRVNFVNGNQSKSFAFDSVVGVEQGQEELFQKVGLNSTLHCLEGYNCSIFAYGQTGSGKTFTMMGVGQQDPKSFEKRGLIPRTLQHLFEIIDKQIQQSRTEYLIKCTFLQIYNQTIIDLLDKNNSNLQIRQDLKKGVYVQGIYEEIISKSQQALQLLRRGSKGRHVGSTYYNQTSSRSHSVFTLLLQSKLTKNGVINVKHRRFHFIDLAGSERTHHSNGERLKQGCSINKSLTVLGMVINSLAEVTQGKTKHVNYRDSKLTFLLKDALGGNSKTHLIANISPSFISYAETLSTLNFARRVKSIKLKKASINQDASGNLQSLKAEIIRLKQQNIALKSHPSNMMMTQSIVANNDPVQTQLERVFLKSDGHLGLQKLLKDYIQESIEKQTKFQVEILKRQQKIVKLCETIKQYTKNQMHMRMIIELYQKRFQRMKALEVQLNKMGQSIQQQNLLQFFQKQRDALNSEVVQLRELLKETPFLKALIKQNNILRDQTKNPEELTNLISANMRFLTELKDELTYSIKQREELNNVIESYSMQKNTEAMSPRKQQQIQNQFKDKQKQYQEKIQQLSLDVAYLKSNLEQSELLLQHSVDKEIVLEDKIKSLEDTISILEEKNKEIARIEELQNEIRQRIEKQIQLQNKITAMEIMEQQLITVKEDLSRKQKQLERLKQSHGKEIEMIKQQDISYKQKMASHQVSMKQIFDECLQNKQKLINQLKSQFTKQLLEEKSQVQSQKQQIKQLESKIKEIQTLNQQNKSTLVQNSQVIEELKQKLEHQKYQAVVQVQQRQNAHSQFIDRKNEQIQELQSSIKQLQQQVLEKESLIVGKQQSLTSIKQNFIQIIGVTEDDNANYESFIQTLKHKFIQISNAESMLKTRNIQIQKMNEELSCKLQDINSKRIQQQQERLRIQEKIVQLQAKIQIFKNQEQKIQSQKSQLQARIINIQNTKDSITTVLESQQAKILLLCEQMQGLKKQLSQKENLLSDKIRDLIQKEQTIKQNDEVILSTKMILNQKQEQIKKRQYTIQQKDEQISEMKIQIQQKNEKIRGFQNVISQNQNSNSEHQEFLRTKLQQLQQKQTELKLKTQQLQQKDAFLQQRDKIIQKQSKQIIEKQQIISKNKALLLQKESQIQEKNTTLKQNNEVILEKDQIISQKQQLIQLKDEQLLAKSQQMKTKVEQKQSTTGLIEEKEAIIQKITLQLLVKDDIISNKQKIITQLNDKQYSFSQQISRLENELTSTNCKIGQYEQQLLQQRNKNDQVQKQFQQIQKILYQSQKIKQQMYLSNQSVQSQLQKSEEQIKQLNSYRKKLQEANCQLHKSLSENHQLINQIDLIKTKNNFLEKENDTLKKQTQDLRDINQSNVNRIQDLNKQISAINKNNEEFQINRQKNEQLIIKQEEYNRQLQEKVNLFNRQNTELKDSLQKSLNKIQKFEVEKTNLQEELNKQRHSAINKLRLMEEMQLKMTDEKHNQLQRINQQFINEIEKQKHRFDQEREYLNTQNFNLLEQNKLLAQKNKQLTESIQESKEALKAIDNQLARETDKTIGLKRLIQNLQKQKQQLQKQLEEKEASYKRLLSKICKDGQPKKASQQARLRTNELLQKSRLQLLQYKKVIDENNKQIKKMKADMQAKQDNFLEMRQKSEEHYKAQENSTLELKSDYMKLENEYSLLIKQIQQLYIIRDQTQTLKQQLAGYKSYKEKSERKREDLQRTIKSLTDELEMSKNKMDGRNTLSRGQDEKLVYINKLKEENNLLKNQKYTLSDQTVRLQRQNKLLKEKLTEETEQKLRLKQMQERKHTKDNSQRQINNSQMAFRIQLQNKTNQVRYLQQGYATICRILNIKNFSDAKNRGESTLGMIKDVIQELTEEVSMLRNGLKQRQKELQSKNLKIQIISRECNHLKSKDYRRSNGPQFNPIKNALQQTNKLVGQEYNSFQNIKIRALELKEQSKLRRDRF